jgi:hypothetical protein
MHTQDLYPIRQVERYISIFFQKEWDFSDFPDQSIRGYPTGFMAGVFFLDVGTGIIF